MLVHIRTGERGWCFPVSLFVSICLYFDFFIIFFSSPPSLPLSTSSVMSVYSSPVIPMHDATDLSISQFMTQYNPDDVPPSKIVHTDTCSTDPITYGSLREQSGQAAWGLQRKLAFQPGNTLLALVNNSVRLAKQQVEPLVGGV